MSMIAATDQLDHPGTEADTVAGSHGECFELARVNARLIQYHAARVTRTYQKYAQIGTSDDIANELLVRIARRWKTDRERRPDIDPDRLFRSILSFERIGYARDMRERIGCEHRAMEGLATGEMSPWQAKVRESRQNANAPNSVLRSIASRPPRRFRLTIPGDEAVELLHAALDAVDSFETWQVLRHRGNGFTREYFAQAGILSLPKYKRRAIAGYKQVRDFFEARGALEVLVSDGNDAKSVESE